MRINKTLLCVFLFSIVVPGAAQNDFDYRGEVYGSLGWGRFGDSEGSLGNGANFGGGAGLRLSPRLGFEFDVSRARHARETGLFGGLRFEGTGTYFTGNVVYHFAESRVQPYLLAGAGAMRYDGSIRIRDFPDPLDPTVFTETTIQLDGNGFAWNAGAGLKIFLTQNLSLRPEARFFVGRPSGLTESLSVARVSVALSYHW